MNKAFPSLLLMFVFVATACSGGSKDKYDVADSDSTVIADSLAVGKEEPGKPYIRFSSADSAMKFMKESPDCDKYMQGVFPSLVQENLKYAEKLLNNTHPGFIVVDKRRMLVILYDAYGRVKAEYGMACAKNFGTKHSKGDSRTPEGFFSVEGVYDSTDWLFTDDDGVTSDVKGQFGPRFIRIRIPGTSQIGIHGTCAPWSIGGRRSHGCIRIKNENILKLVEEVEPGMPVIISPGRQDLIVNHREGYDIPTFTTSGKPLKIDFEAIEAAEHRDSLAREQQQLIDSVASPNHDPMPKNETDTI